MSMDLTRPFAQTQPEPQPCVIVREDIRAEVPAVNNHSVDTGASRKFGSSIALQPNQNRS